MEVGETDADRDELRDQGDQVGHDEVAGREPAPQLSEPLEHELAIATMGDRADPHAHLLAHDRHPEADHDERKEEPEAVRGAARRVGDHARPVVLAQHREDPRTDQQPQQVPAPPILARVVDPEAVPRPQQILVGQPGGEARRLPVDGGALERRLRDRPGTRRRHRLDLHPHRLGQRAAEHLHPIAEAHEQRAVERLLVDHLELIAGSDAVVGQEAEHLGVGIGHAHERSGGAGLERLKALGAALLDRQITGRDRIAVRVVGGVPELGRDQILELVREHVLEHLGLLVHPIPGHPERLDQIQLEQAVMAHHLERHAPAVLGQRHTAVGLVLDQAELAEALDHPGRRRGGDAEALGERVGAHRFGVAPLQGVDRLGVVLDRLRRRHGLWVAMTKVMVCLNLNFQAVFG